MVDAGTSHTPGVRGQTRSTWRDPAHLRGLLWKLIKLHPDASRDEVEALYLKEAKGDDFTALPKHEAFINEALRRAFDNDWARAQDSSSSGRGKRPPLTEAEIAAEAARVRSIILLDLVMPNGKRLRACTGDECGTFSGWFVKLRERVGSALVGDTLTEQDLIDLRDG